MKAKKNRQITHIKLVYLVMLAMLTTNQTNAQITIGSEEAAMSGAILQLKETIGVTNGGSNATKGLLLPRVELTDFSKLMPMYSYEDAANEPSQDDIDKHNGLTVYNIAAPYVGAPCIPNTSSPFASSITSGVYIWDRGQWVLIKATSTSGESAAPKEYKDQDENIFYATIFGDAGEWMIQNLRAKTYAQGGTAPTLSTATQVAPHDQKYWAYPGIDAISMPPIPPGTATGAVDGTDPYYYNENPTIGLLYSWAAATNNEQPGNIDQGQDSPDELTGNIQGICPNGWHLPSDREWNELEKEIYNNASQYSAYTVAEMGEFSPASPTPGWKVAWESGIDARDWRGSFVVPAGDIDLVGHGQAMKNVCTAPEIDINLIPTKGKSYTSGFNAILVGAAIDGALHRYGSIATYWTSATFDTDQAWFRWLDFDNSMVRRDPANRGALKSIRCKKN